MTGIIGELCQQGKHDDCHVEGCECLCHEFRDRPGQAVSHAEGSEA